MIEITAEIRAFIDKAAAGVELAEDEYIDPSDGLIHCKKCGGQRQTVVPVSYTHLRLLHCRYQAAGNLPERGRPQQQGQRFHPSGSAEYAPLL